jgi:hypothetical protein
MANKSRTPIMEYARVGFGTGLGVFASMAIFILVGLLLFIPGLVLVNREQAKPKETQNNSMKILGYVLMALGAAIGLGIGAGTLFSELSSEF